jgi:hypothetical protein
MKASLNAGRIVVVILLLIGTTPATSATLAIKGGLNLARPWNLESDISYLTMKPGLMVGASLEIPVMGRFSLQPEVLFSSKGYRISQDAYNRVVINFNYLEIPVLFKGNIPLGIVIPNLYIGPVLSFLAAVSGYTINDGDRRNFDKDFEKAYKQQSNAIDFGLAVGGGVSVAAGTGHFIFDVRYTLGFVSIDDNAQPPDKNSALSFTAGYAFPLEVN